MNNKIKNTRTQKRINTFLFLLVLAISSCKKEQIEIPPVTPSYDDKVSLGKNIFFDKTLSSPMGQSCSSCHAPETAFSDFTHDVVSPGALDGLFGNRNAPSIIYSMYAPAPLQYSDADGSFVGGQFLDGRANTLEDQAKGPFLNPLEMGNNSIEMLINKIKSATYYNLYQKVYGSISDANAAFNNIADALATYERSNTFANRFTSKFDYYLQGQASLTAEELNGYNLFVDTLKGKCANCHLVTPDAASGQILFTDFTYDNIGVPKNPNNPFYTLPTGFNAAGSAYIDKGLGATVANSAYNGAFKVPSLRNVALTAPYFHNGYFNTLDDVVHFYNLRDSLFNNPEVPGNVNHEELGKLKLSATEEKALVAFMKTLTDGYR
ncbi:MAG: cytochrome B6 [Bacteroidetes bacterium]|nr:cytochrome B6 [Bacteroidota bacterium]